MERETRLELATLALARRCSTTELLPLLELSDSNDSNQVVKRGALAVLVQFGSLSYWSRSVNEVSTVTR